MEAKRRGTKKPNSPLPPSQSCSLLKGELILFFHLLFKSFGLWSFVTATLANCTVGIVILILLQTFLVFSPLASTGFLLVGKRLSFPTPVRGFHSIKSECDCKKFFQYMHLFIYSRGWHAHATACVQKSEDNLKESDLIFHHRGFRNEIQTSSLVAMAFTC